MINLTSTGVCNTGTSALYVCNLLLWLTWWMLLYRTLIKVTCTNMRKKHVRRDSKMCCCCCRSCCGAPTTDERIHAPVLHDASQIAYCRYWGRASLPPITSNILEYTITGTRYIRRGATTRLAYDIIVYLETYVRWCHLFIFVWGIGFVSVIRVFAKVRF